MTEVLTSWTFWIGLWGTIMLTITLIIVIWALKEPTDGDE